MINPTQKELFTSGASDSNWFDTLLKQLDVQENSDNWVDKFGKKLHATMVGNTNPVRVLSLFSGAGGLDIGFHDAGFKIIECNELEPLFASTLINNTGAGKTLNGSKIVCKDIREYTPDLEDIDFIIGGPPCQTFSAAGARAAGVNGIDDQRGTLFNEYVRILKLLKPAGFLFENVYRIVGAQGGKPWRMIQKAFEDAGYKLFWRVIDAADYGVPQHRERLIIVGVKTGRFNFPKPTHGPDSANAKNYYSANKALHGLSIKNKDLKTINGRHGHLLKDIPPGLNYSFYTDRMGHPTPLFGWRSKFSDYLYKADPEMPVRTIKAQGGQYTGPFHWEARYFTIEELKRLQTFPDDYELVGNRAKIIHQIGNSVPPHMARILALAVLKQVFKHKVPFEMGELQPNEKLGFRTRKSALTKKYAEKAKRAIEQLAIESHSSEINANGNLYVSVDKNLKLCLHNTPQKGHTTVCYSITNGNWKIIIGDAEKYLFGIEINPSIENSNISNIKLLSDSTRKNHLTILWKSLEYLVRKFAHKDDLVQLFGHYKTRNQFRLKLICNHKDQNSLFWKVTAAITSGRYASSMTHIEDMAKDFETNITDIHEILIHLKSLGFEIRNNNTNKQLPIDYVLVPYAFPTLNERSLQRFKEL